MGMRRVLVSLVGAVALLGVWAVPAQAFPSPELKSVITVGCQDESGTFFLEVIPQGAVAFVLADSGEPTGEILFLVSVDAAAFTDEGVLVGEFHKTYGQRTGHGDPIFCSGSFVEEPGVTVFFDVLVTRPMG
jgi:hypothetical protein